MFVCFYLTNFKEFRYQSTEEFQWGFRGTINIISGFVVMINEMSINGQ